MRATPRTTRSGAVRLSSGGRTGRSPYRAGRSPRRGGRERGVDVRAIEGRRESGDEIVDGAAQESSSTERDPGDRRCEQMGRIELLEYARVTYRIPRHFRDDADTEPHLDIRLDHVGIERRQHDVRHEARGIECRIDLRPAGEREVVGDDRMARERGKRERL